MLSGFTVTGQGYVEEMEEGRQSSDLYWTRGQQCAKMTFELMERKASETVEQKQKERT